MLLLLLHENSLVPLLEAPFARIFFWTWNIGVLTFVIYHFLLCEAFVSHKHPFFRFSQPGSCAWLSPFLFCADYKFVLVCVCLCISVRVTVSIKVININKYKQNRDDVTCNIKVETEIDIYSDVKQAVKWQVFGHVTNYNTNETHTPTACFAAISRFPCIIF